MPHDGEYGIVAGLADVACGHEGRQEHGGVNGDGVVGGHIEGVDQCEVGGDGVLVGTLHGAHNPDGEEVVGSHELGRQSGVSSLQPVQCLYHGLAVGECGEILLVPCVGVANAHVAVAELVDDIVFGSLTHPVNPRDALAEGCLDFLSDVDEFVL